MAVVVTLERRCNPASRRVPAQYLRAYLRCPAFLFLLSGRFAIVALEQSRHPHPRLNPEVASSAFDLLKNDFAFAGMFLQTSLFAFVALSSRERSDRRFQCVCIHFAGLGNPTFLSELVKRYPA
jgi:hypothetical protein